MQIIMQKSNRLLLPNKNYAIIFFFFSVHFKSLIFQFYFPFGTSIEIRIELDFFFLNVSI